MTDAEASVTKKLLSMTKRQTESGGTYGSLSYKPAGAPQEVDDSIPLSLSHMVVNGTTSDEGSARRIFRNGNTLLRILSTVKISSVIWNV